VRLEAAGEVAIVRTASNIDLPAPLPRILILMEGADPIRSPEHVPSWKERGVRLVGLTWATGTRYAGGNAGNPGEGPLTALGVEMVRALDEAGIVHDASHLSDAAFDGLLEHAAGPIVASHSNCRALLEPRQRHLRDDQIRAIARRDGIIGLNLYSPFLARDRRANIADCVAHLEHVCEIAGHRRCVALGSDMDGGFTPNHLPTGLDRPEALEALAEALRDAGWSDDEVRGFASGNWRRFLSGLSW
jgi:membrane dipeptidase